MTSLAEADAHAAAHDGEPVASGVTIPMTEADRHHAADVLRLDSGSHVVVVEPDGTASEVELGEVTRHHISGSVIAALPAEEGPRVTLIQGLPKGSRMDTVVEKAVEIGVVRVVPLESERSVVRLDDRKRRDRVERWRRIALAAAKQSQRGLVPEVLDLVDVDALIDSFSLYDRVLVLWEEERACTLSQALARVAADERVAVIVGPEGGLTPQEVALMLHAGAEAVTIGSTILRTETAGIIGPALVIHHLGGLGGERRV